MAYYVVTFDSTHGAISARRAMEKSIPIRTIPVPRAISAACGIAITFEVAQLATVTAVLKTLDMEGEYAIHEMR